MKAVGTVWVSRKSGMRFLFFLIAVLLHSLQIGTTRATPAGTAQATHAPLKIVASIPPLASLAQSMLGSEAEVVLLLDTQASPHSYYMKPSDMGALEKADLILWVGPSLESFLVPSLKKYRHKSFTVMELETLALLPYRMPSSEGPSHTSEGSSHTDAHVSGTTDPHVWLDPHKVMHIAQALRDELAKRFPDLTSVLDARYNLLEKDLKRLDADLKTILQPVLDHRFFVIHDAFQYLEARYALQPSLQMSAHPESGVTLKRLRTLKKAARTHRARCLFGDRAYDPDLLAKFARKLGLSYQILDVLGYMPQGGPRDYLSMMRQLGQDIRACLSSESSS